MRKEEEKKVCAGKKEEREEEEAAKGRGRWRCKDCLDVWHAQSVANQRQASARSHLRSAKRVGVHRGAGEQIGARERVV